MAMPSIIIDYKQLEVIYGCCRSKPSARIERLVLRLEPYRFTVQCKPGTDNPADYLSRYPTSESISRQKKITIARKSGNIALAY